jgi:hypothetical protein
MKNRVFSTIVIVLLFTLAFLCCFRACVGAIEGNLDGGNAEIIEGADNPSVADDGDTSLYTKEADGSNEAEIIEGETSSLGTDNESAGVEPPPRGEGEEKFDLKTYVEERIVPVISGVGAAIVAIFVALGPLVSAIRAIKNAAASFSKKDEERNASVKESNRLMQKNIERIETSVKDVPALQAQNEQFKKQVDELKLVCTTLARITALGFQANADVVRSGKGKKMAVMLKKLSSTVGDIEGTFEEVKENDEAEI